jgi:hypothetical protein
MWLAPSFAQPFQYEARHEHLRNGGGGTLTIDGKGVSFKEGGKKHDHAWQWDYQDIQQLEIAPKTLRVLTYKDNKWKLGADREYRFDLLSEGTFSGAYDFLKRRLDQRFVAALPDPEVKPLWEIPAKHLLRLGGTEGTLIIGEDAIVYKAGTKDDSRTWRYSDVESVSSSGPFQLTLTTFERARAHYGNLKGFNFQLKEALKEDRYNQLWERVNASKGLKFLATYKDH